MRVLVNEIGAGLHPSEVIVEIQTSEGNQQVAIDRALVSEGRMKAYAVRQVEDEVLVELPREAANGAWRVWVPRESIFLQDEVSA